MSNDAAKLIDMKRIMVASAIALSLAACSALPDETRPGFIYGSDNPAKTNSDEKSFPNLADVPDQAPAGSSPAQRQQMASALANDRSAAEAGDVALRAGKSEAVVQSGAAAPGAAEMAEAPVQKAAPESAKPAIAPVAPSAAPQTVPANVPVSEAPSAAEEAKVAAAEELDRSPRQQYAATPEPEQAAVSSPTLRAGTEPAAPAPVSPASAPVQQLAAVDQSPVLTPPAESPSPAGAIVPFPSRGGHARLADIKGGIELSAGSDAPHPDVVSEEDEESGARVNPAPTTPVEVKPADSQP